MKGLINRHGFVLPKHTLFGSIRFSVTVCLFCQSLICTVFFSGIRNAIEEHIKECESCRTYLKKMEGEIPIETDKIEGTDEEWKGFREFSEKVSR